MSSEISASARASALVSIAAHVLVGLLVLRARAEAPAVERPLEIDIAVDPAPSPPPLHELALGSSGAGKLPERTIERSRPAPAAAIVVADHSTVAAPATTEDSAPAGVDEVSVHAQGSEPCDGADCIFEDLERCRSGDGDGCVGVGLYYEQRRNDPFSAIKWYLRGCGLSSRAACEANRRVADAMPLGWDHHPIYAPSDDQRPFP